MLPPNTVEITTDQWFELHKIDEPVIVWRLLLDEWKSFSTFDDNDDIASFHIKRIQAHDYLHYFGEVVDLKDIYDRTPLAWLNYLGHKFLIWQNLPNEYLVVNFAEKVLFKSDNISECKQWIADHFTELIKKDLPHTNIKFIFS